MWSLTLKLMKLMPLNLVQGPFYEYSFIFIFKNNQNLRIGCSKERGDNKKIDPLDYLRLTMERWIDCHDHQLQNYPLTTRWELHSLLSKEPWKSFTRHSLLSLCRITHMVKSIPFKSMLWRYSIDNFELLSLSLCSVTHKVNP